MKKISLLLFITLTCLCSLSSCKYLKEKAEKSRAKTKAVIEERLYTDAFVKSMDSLMTEFKKVNSFAMTTVLEENNLLTEAEKKVKPDFLLPLSTANTLVTNSEKTAALGYYIIDRATAILHEMPVIEEYDNTIIKLATDLGLTPINNMLNKEGSNVSQERLVDTYDFFVSNNQLDVFWSMFLAINVEVLYSIIMDPIIPAKLSDLDDNSNDDKDPLKELIVIHKALKKLEEFHPEIKTTCELIEPFMAIQTNNPGDLKAELMSQKEMILEIRAQLINQ